MVLEVENASARAVFVRLQRSSMHDHAGGRRACRPVSPRRARRARTSMHRRAHMCATLPERRPVCVRTISRSCARTILPVCARTILGCTIFHICANNFGGMQKRASWARFHVCANNFKGRLRRENDRWIPETCGSA